MIFPDLHTRNFNIEKKYFSNFSSLDCRPTWFSVSSEAPSPGEAGAGAGQRRRLYCGRRAVFCDALDTQGGAQSLETHLRLDADVADAEEAEAVSEARSGCGSRSSYSSSVFSASQSSLPRSRVSRVSCVTCVMCHV